MKRAALSAWIGGAWLLAFAPVASAQTVQSNTVTVTAGHYVQTGTQTVPETVEVPEEQCQNVQVQTGAQTGQCAMGYYTFYQNGVLEGTTFNYCPEDASLTYVTTSYGSNGYAYVYNYSIPIYTTEQECQTVYVQQTQYVSQPVYSWVPTSVS
ncbi:hypothetical protein IW967_02900 [Alicyclobacillus mali]|uniref:Uncharacterized protein n=1 Tax=Alicyclobacillus mali (ex Roth et al. 2021) TaxID=1123961 RepID=A0ABS0F0I3_9BACL|nr:hypothetical protein [Alicyclobacillus mali (ex Roth et al. 2021)]MBF8376821.1 hypothetical protein [Alicyclobacillus mali (ex Roth et al. 2021)]